VPEKETVGQRLSRLRKEAGFTQKELAEKLDISRSSIAEYERDSHNLNDQLVIKLAAVFRVSADEILGLKGAKDYSGKPSLRFLRRLSKIEKLSSAKQKALLTTIDNFLKAEGMK
jgi:transcriptional regulator with XRE-family HTH domain